MIWRECRGADVIHPIRGRLYRLVESQERAATLGYVNTLAEQAVLEGLLETVKPATAETEVPLHYLLTTPFRYPPLKWGSRFGRVYEPSLFYGGKSLEVTLAEAAFYRLIFLHTMEGKSPAGSLKTAHTVLTARYSTKLGVRLQSPPCNRRREQLAHKSDYHATQQLGSDMRAAGVAAFEYLSARAEGKGVCVALFTPAAFTASLPDSQEPWLCETTRDGVTFNAPHEGPYWFALEQFVVNGVLPLPA